MAGGTSAIELLPMEEGDTEPKLNLAVTARDDKLVALLFPRGKHRPAAFFAEGPEQRLVSPGVIDLAGVIVTVREGDFEALDGGEVASILDQVTLQPAQRDAWLAALNARWTDG
jgi:hypothetical protein